MWSAPSTPQPPRTVRTVRVPSSSLRESTQVAWPSPTRSLPFSCRGPDRARDLRSAFRTLPPPHTPPRRVTYMLATSFEPSSFCLPAARARDHLRTGVPPSGITTGSGWGDASTEPYRNPNRSRSSCTIIIACNFVCNLIPPGACESMLFRPLPLHLRATLFNPRLTPT
ncbi:hypothetical protein C8Q73DRAFT_16282 [Cubamyces lactineus]|nr:hypothetical protein C8Q73DRAFT_16282 [Cubamyces lactineus]